MHVLITGGAGFIGSHLAERLLADNHSVSVLDDLSTGSIENLAFAEAHGERFSFIEGSVLDTDVVGPAVEAADCVFHLAAAVGVRLIVEEPSRSIMTNVAGTERVLEACLKGDKRVFIASSSEVYGKSRKFPQSETDDLIIGASENLRWSYATSKLVNECLALSYAQEHDLQVTIVRFFNTTGPRQSSQYGMVIPTFVDAALRGDPLFVHGSGEQTRCFCHVQDVIEALSRLMQTPDSVGQIFNVANGAEVRISELAQKVVDVTGSSSQVELIPYEHAYGPGFEDMQRRHPDVSKLERVAGFKPGITLDQIIADIVTERKQRL